MALLLILGVHRLRILQLYARHRDEPLPPPPLPEDGLPRVTVQLPIYNERHVAERLIDAVARLDYPAHRLEIQVLDDSTDDTADLVDARAAAWLRRGRLVRVLRRGERRGFKAGALAAGLATCEGELIAIFDADFLPPPDFLRRLVPHFQDAAVGMVQTRWGHLNERASRLTRLQALYLDAHFLLEHTARHRSGAFFNFNGTAGVWRKAAIESAGGWSARTLTEDMDLSYRAQLLGWKFIYRPDIVCPAELPADIQAFRTQQARWTQGAVQTARLVLPVIRRAPVPRHVKIEAAFHLTAYLASVVTFLLVLLSLPALWWAGHAPALFSVMQSVIFAATLMSLAFYYATVRRITGHKARGVLLDLPALFALGIGMSLVNTRAAWRGWRRAGGEFIRTPKDGGRSLGRCYAHREGHDLPHIILMAYTILTLVAVIATGRWAALPFTALVAGGFLYVGFLLKRSSHDKGPRPGEGRGPCWV